MAQQPIELILARELAAFLTTPIMLVDDEGNLLFYNEPAEKLLGTRFDERGPMALEEWSTAFLPTDASGNRVAPEALPLVIALRERRPSVARLWIRGLDGVPREVEGTALPLDGHAGRRLGALAIFWEAPLTADR